MSEFIMALDMLVIAGRLNFTKATRVSITVQIPPELEPGTYTVKIRTQTESAFSQQIITVL